jgi:hypothetical protein
LKKACLVSSLLVFGLLFLAGTVAAETLKGKALAVKKSTAVPAAKPAPVPIANLSIPQEATESPFSLGLGYGGGALTVGVGYKLPNDRFKLSSGVEYGIGRQYSVGIFNIINVMLDRDPLCYSAGIDYAIYSQLVDKIPGISGTIPGKDLFGLNVFVGKKMGDFDGKIGYSTSLGLRAQMSYKFDMNVKFY